jgi:hypothetical protein
VAGRDVDPPVAVAEGYIGALFKAQFVDVELDRPILIGHWDNDRADLVDIGLGGGHTSSMKVWITPAWTGERAETHRYRRAAQELDGARVGQSADSPGFPVAEADVARPYALFVLTLAANQISAITWFADSSVFPQFGLPRMLR